MFKKQNKNVCDAHPKYDYKMIELIVIHFFLKSGGTIDQSNYMIKNP